MGMCIRVHGVLFPSIRAGLLLTALLMIVVLPVAAQEMAESQPAGVTVPPHWSPYTPPDNLSSAEQVYIIVRGDCLWNLAGRFYGDPLLWPQIWDANRYITDAHWIYPGDPLVVPGAPDVAARRMVEGEDEFGEEPLPGDAADELEGEPVPPGEMIDPEASGEDGGDRVSYEMVTPGSVVYQVDVYCAVMIVPDHDIFKYTITGAEEMEKVAQTVEDLVYFGGGEDDGIAAGDRFFVLHDFGKVKHPETGRSMGWALRQVGELEVLTVNEHGAIAVITHGCASIGVGDLLLPWEDLAVPVVEPTDLMDRLDDVSGDDDGYLVYFLDKQYAAAQGTLSVIDKGSDDGVGVGDFFTIYRMQQGQYLALGEAVVLRTERDTASVKITTSLREIYVGDRVALKN